MVRAAKHCLGRHCNDGIRISVLFADGHGMSNISRLSISNADINDIADVAHRLPVATTAWYYQIGMDPII